MDTIVTIDEMVFMAKDIRPIYKDKRNKIEIIVENNIVNRVEQYLTTHNMITLGIEMGGDKIEMVISDIGTIREYYAEKSTIIWIVFKIYVVKE